MEPYLESIEAWCWRYLENQRNYSGLQFTALPAACDAILRCLDTLRDEGDGSHRTMPLRHLDPSDEEKVSGGQRYACYPRLRISLHAESDELRQYSFRVVDELVHFDLTERYIGDFEQGLRDVRAGSGDYSISALDFTREGRLLGRLDRESEDLWFWPCFGHLSVVLKTPN